MVSVTREKPVTIAQISDLHVNKAGLNHYGVDAAAGLVRCVAHLCALDPVPDMVVASGDLVDAGNAHEYARLKQLLAKIAVPICLMPGNHDRRAPLRQVFGEHDYLGSGESRMHYYRDVRGLRVIALDSLIEGQIQGNLDEAQLQWLDGLLRQAPLQPVLIFLHHPPVPTGFARMDQIALEVASAERLGAILANHPQVRAVLCGHMHRNVQIAWQGTLVSVCPSTAFQAKLRLGPGRFEASPDEPPAYQLHYWDGRNLATHTVTV